MTTPLHRPISARGATVCAHCWDLVLIGDDRGAESYSVDTIPDVALWPCPTSSRTLDLYALEVDGDLILGLAEAEHDLSEEDYDEDEREPFDSLELEDQAYIMHEAKIWITALLRYARGRL